MRRMRTCLLAMGVLSLVLWVSAPSVVQALGLGSLQQESGLNEPFKARIELLSATPDELAALKIKLADDEQFERAGIDRPFLLTKLRFRVVESSRGPDFIAITTEDTVREPFLDFLVELNWPRGRLIREYTVLLDPPLYDPNKRLVYQTPEPAAPIAMPQPSAPPVDYQSDPDQPVYEPTTDYAAPASTTTTTSSYGDTLGRETDSSDTLWSIATATRPDSSVSVQQMMLALLRANPEAFTQNNINLLKRGYVLRIPSYDEAIADGRADAIAEVGRQHALWEEYRGSVTTTTTERPIGPADDDYEPQSVAPEDDDTEGQLKLVSPTDESLGADEFGTGETLEGLRNELNITNETLTAQQQENAELKDQVGEASEIIDSLERMVNVQDEQLAAYQQQLAAQENGELGTDEIIDPIVDELVDDASDDLVDESADDYAVVDEEPLVDELVDELSDEMVDDFVDEVDEVTDEVADVVVPEVSTPTVAVPPQGFMGRLNGWVSAILPASLVDMVPGGGASVLGLLALIIIAVVVLGLRALGGRDEVEAVSGVTKPAPEPEFVGEETVAALTAPASDDDLMSEDQTIERDIEATKLEAEPEAEEDWQATTALDTLPSAVEAQDITALAAESDETVAPDAEEEDPLAEVNVYLAYERFDQAEELVNKAIADHPNEHKYKLRLLEVYYSSNNRAAYEAAAETLNTAVGGEGELWDSALAMWAEMSPDRALFEAGGEPLPATEDAAPASEFVDITGLADDEEPGESTLVSAPTGFLDDEPETAPPTQALDDTGNLDFDLGAQNTAALMGAAGLGAAAAAAAGADDDELLGETKPHVGDVDLLEPTAGQDEVLDLSETAAGVGLADFDAEDSVLDVTDSGIADSEILDIAGTDGEVGTAAGEILDITESHEDGILGLVEAEATAHSKQDPDVLDLTGDGEVNAVTELLDISGGGDASESSDDGILDLTTEGDSDFLDLTGPTPEAMGDDLLDVTATGDVTGMEHDDLLNVTTPGSPLEDEERSADDDLLDITASLPDAEVVGDDADSSIEFDISGGEELEDAGAIDVTGGDVTDETLELPRSPLAARGADDNVLEFGSGQATEDTGDMTELLLSPENDLQDETLEIDLADTGNLDRSAAATTDSEGESLLEDPVLDDVMGEEGDFEIEGLGGLDLGDPVESNDPSLLETADLDSLSTDGENESLEDLTKSLEDTVAGLTALDEEPQSDDTVELDLIMDDDELSATSEGMETLELDSEDDEAGDSPFAQQTITLDRDPGTESQSEEDEVDTKLNLAKAYIELGDQDGARTILDEVSGEGTEAQKQEAQELINQL